MPGIISATTWSAALDDPASSAFTLAYARAFGRLPDALSAAGYDSLRMIARAAAAPGPLERALAAMQSHQGIQGPLGGASLPAGELSANALVTRLNKYGYPALASKPSSPSAELELARPTPRPTATPLPSATPTGFHLIIQSDYQNIRSGPGLEYDIIGQVLQGAQLRVLGATADYSWLVIDYRGQWGWLAAYLVETFGSRHLVPIIQPPATSTPAPTATSAPPREPDLVVVAASPDRLTLDESSMISLSVRNQGLSAAGSFAIAGTFPARRAIRGPQPGGPGAIRSDDSPSHAQAAWRVGSAVGCHRGRPQPASA